MNVRLSIVVGLLVDNFIFNDASFQSTTKIIGTNVVCYDLYHLLISTGFVNRRWIKRNSYGYIKRLDYPRIYVLIRT